MPTVLLTYWLCTFGTVCDPDHAAKYNGRSSMGTHELHTDDLTRCEEIDAWTNMPEFQTILDLGLAPRHTCVVGDNL